MIHLANIIHESGVDPLHPQWDTLIALRNLTGREAVAKITITGDGGNTVPWPRFDREGTEPGCLVILKPWSSWVASFIPGNGFSALQGASVGPPQDFRGHAGITCEQAIQAFALIAKEQWKYGVACPVRHSESLASPLWRGAYAIPNFDDRSGATAALWETGVGIQNLGERPADVQLVYTIGQTYREHGQSYRLRCTVPVGGVRFDLLRGNPEHGVPGLLTVGYPADLNSEGHVDIATAEPASLYPSLIIANSDYSFMVAEEFQ